MKIDRIILLSLIALAYFAANAHGVLDPGEVSLEPGESMADKLFDLSKNPEIYKNDGGFPATPDASKKEWANRTNNLNVPMPTSLSSGGMSAKASRSQAESESADAAEDTTAYATASETTNATASSETELPPATARASVAGLWSFELNDTTQKYAVITILQNGDELSGEGSLREGNDTLKTAVSGSLQADKMNLVITTLGTISQYKLALGLSGDSAIGNYTAFSANGDSWTGSADGLKTG
jgi:hypothetical protein